MFNKRAFVEVLTTLNDVMKPYLNSASCCSCGELDLDKGRYKRFAESPPILCLGKISQYNVCLAAICCNVVVRLAGSLKLIAIQMCVARPSFHNLSQNSSSA